MSTIIQYKCPSCGGVLEFNSTTQNMKCPYCESEFDTNTQFVKDELLEDNSTFSENDSSEFAVYHCDSCDAEVITDLTTAATHCPYCNNVIIITDKLSGQLKPDIVIPFSYDKNSAKEALKNHLKGKKLLPKGFSDENHLDEIKGVYIPFWIYDTNVIANATFDATRVRSWADRNYNYTETNHYRLTREGLLSFSCVPVDALSSVPNDLTESLEPFDFSKAVPFKTAYLSGYFANKYDESNTECIGRAKQRISKTSMDELYSSVNGYSSVNPVSSNIQMVNITARYCLFPVWILNTDWKGEKYTFAMNGQTGKFVGNLPMDNRLYWKYRILYGGGFAAVLFLIVHFLFGGGIL